MLYELAHFLRDKMPWLWDLIDIANSILFSIRYGSKLKAIESAIILKRGDSSITVPGTAVDKNVEILDGYTVVRLRDVPTEKLVEFFAHQPEEAFKFFKPHGFDAASIKKLQRNKAFLGYVLMDGENIAGYCFNRSFFHGKGFRGRMVDINYRGRGLGTMMNKLLNEVGFGIGLHLYETVNKDNVASYKSALSASNVKVLEELEDGDLYLEIMKD